MGLFYVFFVKSMFFSRKMGHFAFFFEKSMFFRKMGHFCIFLCFLMFWKYFPPKIFGLNVLKIFGLNVLKVFSFFQIVTNVTQWLSDWLTEWRTSQVSRVVYTTKNLTHSLTPHAIHFHLITNCCHEFKIKASFQYPLIEGKNTIIWYFPYKNWKKITFWQNYPLSVISWDNKGLLMKI